MIRARRRTAARTIVTPVKKSGDRYPAVAVSLAGAAGTEHGDS